MKKKPLKQEGSWEELKETVHGMVISVRIFKGAKYSIDVGFDGTPGASRLTTSETIVWMNTLRAMLESAKAIVAESRGSAKQHPKK